MQKDILDKTVDKREQSGNRRIFLISTLVQTKDLLPWDHLLAVVVLVRLCKCRCSAEGMINKDRHNGSTTDETGNGHALSIRPGGICMLQASDLFYDMTQMPYFSCEQAEEQQCKKHVVKTCIGNTDPLAMIQVVIYKIKNK